MINEHLLPSVMMDEAPADDVPTGKPRPRTASSLFEGATGGADMPSFSMADLTPLTDAEKQQRAAGLTDVS